MGREGLRPSGPPLRPGGDRGDATRGSLVHAELQYVWRESGEVGDSSRVAIELGIRDGLISSWYLLDEPD